VAQFADGMGHSPARVRARPEKGGRRMMQRPDVSIIVVSTNNRGDLLANLPAVADGSDELIVVDNGSSDGSPDLVRELAPRARVVELDKNVGFGAANNEGMIVASGRYFLLVNPDARPLGDAIERLVAFADAHPEVGVAGPKLLNADGSLQRSIRGYPTAWWGGRPPRRAPRLSMFFFARRWITGRAGRRGEQQENRRRPLRNEWLKGAVLLLRREAVDKVGGFDSDFFIYNEELDLCYRMSEAGWTIELVPEATFVHVGGTTTARMAPRAYRELLRGHLRMLAKHRSPTHAEHARRYLALVLRFRALLSRGDMRRLYGDGARWLSSGDVQALLRGEG